MRRRQRAVAGREEARRHVLGQRPDRRHAARDRRPDALAGRHLDLLGPERGAQPLGRHRRALLGLAAERTTNSSPAKRATTSVRRKTRTAQAAMLEHQVARLVAPAVVDRLQ
jgi:hypothetical protein